MNAHANAMTWGNVNLKMTTKRQYLCGDLVKVWSLQSFFGGGFINGKFARVRQDVSTTGVSVLLIVERKVIIDDASVDCIDLSYEVYCQQTEFVRKGTEKDIENIDYFVKLNTMIREYEQQKNIEQKKGASTSFSYAPELFFDENTLLQVNRDLLQYPEIFI